MERVERGPDAELDGNTLNQLVAENAERGRGAWAPPAESELPQEPAQTATGADARHVLQDLRAFHLHGRRPPGNVAGPAPLPALLHPYRDLSRVRHEFPFLLDGDGAALRPLTDIIDNAIAAAGDSGDAAEQTRHALLRLETLMRSLASGQGDRLSLVWDRAAATLSETSRLPDEKETTVRTAIARARKALAFDGELVSCDAQAPARIFSFCAARFWSQSCSAWRPELEGLIRRMDDILAADFDHSDAAMQPGHLRETLGEENDMDVEAMSSLLRAAPKAAPIPEERRRRIADTIAILKATQPVFAAERGIRSRAPVHADAVFEGVGEALAEHARRLALMTAFFKAVRVARLEIHNQYRDKVHDEFFASFGERHLTVDETALVPAVLVRVSDEALAQDGAGELLAALESGLHVKVLVEIRSLYHVEKSGDITAAWPLHLAGMAMNLQCAYVLQAPSSRATLLGERMQEGLEFAGPALFAVGVPLCEGDGPGAYLAAAASAESRMLPVLVFDPSRGAALAERVDIGANSQTERTWPVEHFAFRNAAGEESGADIAFTPADFLFCDPRLSRHFWSPAPAAWHDAMLPLHQLLEMPVNEAAGRIPYIVTVDQDNHVGRAVLSREVAAFARRCRSYWLGLCETGGIGNSFAARALAGEREKLVAEKERDIEQIEKNYLSQLEQDVAELAREIVQRIAAQLLGMEGGATVAMPTPAAAPAPRAPAPGPVAETAPTPPAAAADDEVVVIEDAYIDTPLCTSCNECTQLNARIFAYNANKQAEVKDAGAGPFSDIVRAAELCPVHIIHPGKPKHPSEPGLDEWSKRAERYN